MKRFKHLLITSAYVIRKIREINKRMVEIEDDIFTIKNLLMELMPDQLPDKPKTRKAKNGRKSSNKVK